MADKPNARIRAVIQVIGWAVLIGCLLILMGPISLIVMAWLG